MYYLMLVEVQFSGTIIFRTLSPCRLGFFVRQFLMYDVFEIRFFRSRRKLRISPVLESLHGEDLSFPMLLNNFSESGLFNSLQTSHILTKG